MSCFHKRWESKYLQSFDWMTENALHHDEKAGGLVQDRWDTIVVGAVVEALTTDSTVTYYKVHHGIRKPLEGTAGV
jgi:hypothetical protein